MQEKSIIIGLPVVPYNQTKHSDVCKYLDELQEFLATVYTPQVCYNKINGIKHYNAVIKILTL
jgi:hypothetical protein